jgi:hypothetical protein
VKEESGLLEAFARYLRVQLQQGRVQLDADEDEDEYIRMRRFAVAILASLEQALGLSQFEPAQEPDDRDPGIVLAELLADVGDALADYADRVAEESRLRTRRRAVGAAALLVAVAWCWRRRR